MSLHITPAMMEATYNFWLTLPPFRSWKMPESDDVVFAICSDPNNRGGYDYKDGQHRIFVSRRCVGSFETLIRTMAHEMCHVRERSFCSRMDIGHSAAFHRAADQVCKLNLLDRKVF